MRSTYQLAAIYLAVVFVSICTYPVAAQNKSFEVSEKIPTSVHSAASGGFWTSRNDEGFFRAVVIAGGIEHVTHRLYIQWLQNDTKTQSYQLIRTVNVKELNLGMGHVLDVKTSFGDINSFKILVAANRRGGKAKRFAIAAKGAGGYAIRPR